MRSGRASKTAEHNTLFRALEAHQPDTDRIVTDRLAEGFLSWRLRLVTRPARWRLWRHTATKLIDQRWPGVRPTVRARPRLIDDLVGDLVATTPSS